MRLACAFARAQAFLPRAEAKSGRQCAWYADNYSDYDAVACPPGA